MRALEVVTCEFWLNPSDGTETVVFSKSLNVEGVISALEASPAFAAIALMAVALDCVAYDRSYAAAGRDINLAPTEALRKRCVMR